MLINNFLIPLLLTEATELVFAFLIGFRKWQVLLTIVLINIITNPVLNYLILILGSNNLFQNYPFVFLIILEIGVIFAEWRLFLYVFPKEHLEVFKLSVIINFVSALFGIIIFWVSKEPVRTPKPTPKTSIAQITSIPTPVAIKDLVDNEVEFTSQAPFANWKDPRQQDACEEAALLMAVYHKLGKPLTKAVALTEILAISNYQTDTFGEYRDTSASDSAQRILSGYFKYSNYKIRTNTTVNEIIEELNAGNLVVAPTNGRALKNPHFTPPGPERHMVLIKGYNLPTKEFITNDPGVGNGKDFRYPMTNLFDAIRDYPTGNHIPITKTEKTVIAIF